jgi:hypothetical protein
MGYSPVEDLDVAIAQPRYFAQRSDGLLSPPMNHLIGARLA